MKKSLKSLKLKIYISRCIPNTVEGDILRNLIFNSKTNLPENKIIKEIILKFKPDENLNSEFMKL